MWKIEVCVAAGHFLSSKLLVAGFQIRCDLITAFWEAVFG